MTLQLLVAIFLAIVFGIVFVAIFRLFIIPWAYDPNGDCPDPQETLQRIREDWSTACPTLNDTLQTVRAFRRLLMRLRGAGSGPHPSLETTEHEELNLIDSGPQTPTPGGAASPQEVARLRKELGRCGSDGELLRASEKEKTGGPVSRSLSEGLDRDDKEKEL